MDKLTSKIVLKIQSGFNQYGSRVSRIEKSLEFRSSDLYPIFIIGAPRTGSTLLFQLMCNNFKFAYINNLMALLPRYLVGLSAISERFPDNKYVKGSDHGYVPGLFSPNEAGAIFRKWFEEEHPEIEKRTVRNTVVHLSNKRNKPFLAKNMVNSKLNRLVNIYTILPQTRFIVLRRDALFTAQSLLKARQQYSGGIQNWWSVTPDQHQKILNRSPYYQVLWQIWKVKQDIQLFLKRYHPEYLEIDYKKLCTHTNEVLRSIASQFGLRRTHDHFNTDNIKYRESIYLNSHDWNQLMAEYNNFKI